jgi:NADH dehydrogenase FAD-containing subunit
MFCCLLCVQVAYCTAAVAFEDGRRPQFEIPYDMVVVAVGEQPATFGVPGEWLLRPQYAVNLWTFWWCHGCSCVC